MHTEGSDADRTVTDHDGVEVLPGKQEIPDLFDGDNEGDEVDDGGEISLAEEQGWVEGKAPKQPTPSERLLNFLGLRR